MDVNAGDMSLGDLPDGSVPLAAVSALKVMYPDGRVGFLIRMTDDLPLVEALGMANHAVLVIGDAILHPNQ